MSTTKQYELVYIAVPETTEEKLAELHGQIEGIVSRFQGTIEKTDNWGRRRLAYPIGRHKEGIYVLELINGSGELMKELQRRLKVSDAIVRHLLVRVDEDLRMAARAKARRQERTSRRRVARGLPPEPTPEERMKAVAGSHDESGDEAEA
jgi:small subunit ribosomal protein S6